MKSNKSRSTRSKALKSRRSASRERLIEQTASPAPSRAIAPESQSLGLAIPGKSVGGQVLEALGTAARGRDRQWTMADAALRRAARHK
jgi:hypothetical protein